MPLNSKQIFWAFFLFIFILASASFPPAAFSVEEQTIDLDFVQTDVRDILRSLATIAGENLVLDKSVEGKLTINLYGVTFDQALEQIVTVKGLASHTEYGTTIIAQKDRIRDIYHKVERRIVYPDFLNGEELKEVLADLFPEINVRFLSGQNGLILSGFADELGEVMELMDELDQPPRAEGMESIPIRHQEPEEVAEILADFFPELTIRARPDTGNLLMGGPIDRLREAAAAAEKLDVRIQVREVFLPNALPPSVLVEQLEQVFSDGETSLRFTDEVIILEGLQQAVEERLDLLAKLDDVEEKEDYLRLRFDHLDLETAAEITGFFKPDLAVDREPASRSLLLKGPQTSLQKAEELLTDLDKPRLQVLLEARVEEVSHTKLRELGLDISQLRDPAFISFDLEGGLSEGFDIQLPSLFKILEDQGISQTLANPRLLTIDGEEARLAITDQVPVQHQERENGTVVTTYEYIDAGIILNFTPIVTRDHMVLLELEPEVSSFTRTVPEAPPELQTRTVENRIALMDGQTFAIGGLIQDDVVEQMRSIPFVSDLPLVGRLFQYTVKDEVRKEIIIFITPHIIDVADEEISAVRGAERPHTEELLYDEDYLPPAERRTTSKAGFGIKFSRKRPSLELSIDLRPPEERFKLGFELGFKKVGLHSAAARLGYLLKEDFLKEGELRIETGLRKARLEENTELKSGFDIGFLLEKALGEQIVGITDIGVSMFSDDAYLRGKAGFRWEFYGNSFLSVGYFSDQFEGQGLSIGSGISF